MLYGSKREVVTPSLDEIAEMSEPRLRIERIKLKNEISFRRGDMARSGPSRQAEIDQFNKIITTIEERLEKNDGGAK
jgi:hypothetical protein